jgi:hypothetical protein
MTGGMRTRAADSCWGASPYLNLERIEKIWIGEEMGTHLNSLRRAFAASLAFVSVAEARSQTSSTTAQSSDEVAVR